MIDSQSVKTTEGVVFVAMTRARRLRAVRLAEAGVPSETGSGLSKSAVSRRFKALTEARLAEWMASDLSQFDLLVIRIDGFHMTDKLLMIGAVGIDVEGHKHPLGVV